MIEQLGTFTIDFSFVTLMLIVSLFWKEQQIGLIVCSILYLTFTLLWHFPPGILTY